MQGALQDSIDAAAKSGVVNTAEAAASLNSRVDALVEDLTASKSAMDGMVWCLLLESLTPFFFIICECNDGDRIDMVVVAL